LIVLGAGVAISCSAAAGEVCPVRPKHVLKYAGPYDGIPEELASLIPDVAGKRYGYWDLAYVYEAGRFVTFRCKYDDEQIVDIKLPEKVARCEYTFSKKRILRVVCK